MPQEAPEAQERVRDPRNKHGERLETERGEEVDPDHDKLALSSSGSSLKRYQTA